MRFQHVILLAFLVVCLIATVALSNDATQPEVKNSLIKKLFSFDNFKQVFRKSYEGLEDLVRKKLYFGRVFKAFVSLFSFKHGTSSSFLAVNHMSDWTPQEVKLIYVAPEMLDSKLKSLSSDHKVDEESPIPVATLDEVESGIEELSKLPDFVEMAKELVEVNESRRRKRDAEGNTKKTRSVSLRQLMRTPDAPPESSKKIAFSIESNNPNYVTPELESKGASNLAKPLSEQAIGYFMSIPGASYVTGVVASVASSVATAAFDMAMEDRDADVVVEMEAGKIADKEEKIPAERDEDEFEDLSDDPEFKNDNIVYVDHRRSDCFLQVRDQHRCGCCYIFSATALYEYLFCMKTGKLIGLSEQYAIDCGKKSGLKGCIGGQNDHLGLFASEYGFELREKYPYMMVDDETPTQCPFENDQSMGYLRFSGTKLSNIPYNRKLIESSLKQAPVLMGMLTWDTFADYGGGVSMPSKCDDIAHSMLIVGHGRQDGREYWLIRNSLGWDWGEEGYYKLDKAVKDECILMNAFYAPQVESDFSIRRNLERKRSFVKENQDEELDELAKREKKL